MQLYSRTSGRFIQIKKTELDARGKNSSRYGKQLVSLCLTGYKGNQTQHLCAKLVFYYSCYFKIIPCTERENLGTCHNVIFFFS